MLILLNTPNAFSKHIYAQNMAMTLVISVGVCKYFKKIVILKWFKSEHIFLPLSCLFLCEYSVAK